MSNKSVYDTFYCINLGEFYLASRFPFSHGRFSYSILSGHQADL